MQYVEYAKLGLAVLGYLIEIIKDLKQREQTGNSGVDVGVQVDKGVGLLQNVGKIAKVKELQALDITELKPLIADFISKVEDLKKVSK